MRLNKNPARWAWIAVLLAILWGPSGAFTPRARGQDAQGDIPTLGYTVVKEWPHDRGAFTEGLVWWKGMLIESTGLNARSTLRKVDLESGKVVQQVRLRDEFFGEGIAVLGERIYQLTWLSHRGFIYDVNTMALLGEFPFEGEGWGLATDGRYLVMSDGTSRIRFIDPSTFKVARTIDVLAHGKPVERINELEFVRGVLYANVWQTDFILQVDPASGRILGTVDFVGMLPPSERRPDTDVMNGIAYDPKGDRLFVTGKNWPGLFEVRVVPKWQQ